MTCPIYSIGNGKRTQVAMRDDGVWFERFHRENKPGWGKWHRTPDDKRPMHAWYNPSAGKAKLPKDIANEVTLYAE